MFSSSIVETSDCKIITSVPFCLDLIIIKKNLSCLSFFLKAKGDDRRHKKLHFEGNCGVGGLHLNFPTDPLERSAVIWRVDKSQDDVTFRNETKHHGWRVNQTTLIILLLWLLSLGEGCLVESEHSVVTVNVLAVERMNKRKNVSDFDRIQNVVARLLDSVGLVGSFTSAALKHKPESGQRKGDFKRMTGWGSFQTCRCSE